ncbi:MAG TPA: MotA/TolQ/ExbB proton channel family protein [Phycisphaerae bacterium]|nr:MotA/TolQ/ExbB proton channel family protein [Phycisphaerae bacterium]
MPNRTPIRPLWPLVLVALLVAATMGLAATPAERPAAPADAPSASPAAAGPAAAKEPDAKRVSLRDFIEAGSYVGYVIIWLSFAGLALVIDAFLRIQTGKLIPPRLATELVQLARQGKFSEMQTMAGAFDCMLARIVSHTFAQGRMSLDAAREVMQEQGTKEVTRLYQRVGHIGFIAAIAPMLGLLGTVTGMIGSFNVLGTIKGAARPDQLAVGVSEALVTTCMGLVVAIPLMFFHNYFRDRVTRIGQDAAGVCDRLMRTMAEGQVARDHAPVAPDPIQGES